jgi:hypothetical protein
MFPFNFESLFLHLSFEIFFLILNIPMNTKNQRWCKFPLHLFIIVYINQGRCQYNGEV